MAVTWSGIGRPLSFKYPTNRAIIIIVALVFVLGTLIKLVVGDSFITSVFWAFGAAATIFFAWALARELDPDVPTAARTRAPGGQKGPATKTRATTGSAEKCSLPEREKRHRYYYAPRQLRPSPWPS